MDTFFEGNSVIIVIDTGFEGLDSATLIEIIVTKPSEISLNGPQSRSILRTRFGQSWGSR